MQGTGYILLRYLTHRTGHLLPLNIATADLLDPVGGELSVLCQNSHSSSNPLSVYNA